MVQRLFGARTQDPTRRRSRSGCRPGPPPERLDGVLAVLYLVFNEGYHSTSGTEVSRARPRRGSDLADHAAARPASRRARGRRAFSLMELHDARASSTYRVDADGDIDPARRAGPKALGPRANRAAVTRIDRAGRGRYQLEATIAAQHAVAGERRRHGLVFDRSALRQSPTPDTDSPIVALNRAVAVGMADGPTHGLRALDELDDDGLDGYLYLPAARADMQRRLGRLPEAASSYQEALQSGDERGGQALPRTSPSRGQRRPCSGRRDALQG